MFDIFCIFVMIYLCIIVFDVLTNLEVIVSGSACAVLGLVI